MPESRGKGLMVSAFCCQDLGKRDLFIDQARSEVVSNPKPINPREFLSGGAESESRKPTSTFRSSLYGTLLWDQLSYPFFDGTCRLPVDRAPKRQT